MPWIGREQHEQNIKILHELEIRFAKLEAQLVAEVDRRERAELDLAKLQDDFKGLVHVTSGRIPPRMAPEFDKDIFAEDTSRPETFLTPDPDEIGIDIEAILRDIDEPEETDSGEGPEGRI